MSEDRLERERNKKMKGDGAAPSSSSQSGHQQNLLFGSNANATTNNYPSSMARASSSNSTSSNSSGSSNNANSNIGPNSVNNVNDRQNGSSDRDKDVKMNPKMSKALSTSAKRYTDVSLTSTF